MHSFQSPLVTVHSQQVSCRLFQHLVRVVHQNRVHRSKTVVRLVGVLLLLLFKHVVPVDGVQVAKLLEMNEIIRQLSLLGENLMNCKLGRVLVQQLALRPRAWLIWLVGDESLLGLMLLLTVVCICSSLIHLAITCIWLEHSNVHIIRS